MVPPMKKLGDRFADMDLDDFEELLADKPRDETWRRGQKLPSLQRDVLVERDKPVIEVFERAGEAWFKERLIEGLDAVLDLSALGLTIPLAEIHRDVLTA